VIAVDGPAAAGKGTLARGLAAHYGFAYLDTGALYRAAAREVLRRGEDPRDPRAAAAAAAAFSLDGVDPSELRTAAVADASSIVAALPEVRAVLLDRQRAFAEAPPGGAPGAVLDGRDIGTVVCPQAAAKLFVTARPEVRAHRRYLDRLKTDPTADEAAVLDELKARDARDAERLAAPLRAAEDAHLLDTSDLSIEAALDAARSYVDRALGQI